MRNEVHLLATVRRRELDLLVVAERRPLDEPPASCTTEIPVLASNRVTTMPADVHIGCVMYE